jgi:hypothetical protein
MDEKALVELLHSATADPPPSKIIDLSQAKTDGARMLKRRLITVSVASGVAAVAALGTGALVLAANSRPPLPVAPARFDVRRLRIAPGWLPDGLSDIVTTQTGPDRQLLTYERLSAKPGVEGTRDSVQTVRITVYAAEVSPEGPPGWKPPGGTGGWDARFGLLVWRWASNAWATVELEGSVLNLTSAFRDPEGVARHVASALRVDVDQPMRMPFTVAAPSAPLRLVEMETSRFADGRYEALLSFSDEDDGRDPVTQVPRRLDVSAHDTATSTSNGTPTGNGNPNPPVNATIDGHPAYVNFLPDDGHVFVYLANDAWLAVEVYDAAMLADAGEAAAVALAGTIGVVPSARDQSTWTASPIR